MAAPTRPKPLVLAILDGWGHREERENNAIAQAKTPFIDAAMRDYPHGLINASEEHVGLPEGQMGNSEVGHMNIGSGRVLMQDLPRIDEAVASGALAKNPALLKFVGALKKSGGACHLLGLVSPGGVHSHQAHIAALAKLVAAQGIDVCIHAFLDGRDTPPESALEYMAELDKAVWPPPLDAHQRRASPASGRGSVRIATVSGRFYAMDRDKRWDRVQKAYETLARGKGERFKNAAAAIEKNYTNEIFDEFVVPCVIGDYAGMKDGDGLLCGNFRADRVREILTVLLDPDFKEFPRGQMIKFSAALGLTEYSELLVMHMTSLFAPQPLANILGEIISKAGLTQLRIAETEKYAHVTFFFNGGREKEFPGEERILVPSPKVATYDEKPEMSAHEITEKLLTAIAAERFDFIVVNYANTDMVGHTGDIEAAKRAVETVDECLQKLSDAVLAKGGALLITADHGNAEMMFDHATEQAHTAHTLSLVPFLLIDERFKGEKITLAEGRLSDIAPTALALLNIAQPAEMTGRSLLPHGV